jgi:hypothetical protein
MDGTSRNARVDLGERLLGDYVTEMIWPFSTAILFLRDFHALTTADDEERP